MNIIELLIGRKVKVMTEVGVEVEVEIKAIKENHHSRQITPDTPQNDWWGETENWSTYTVTFTTGKSKNYDNLEQIVLVDSSLTIKENKINF